MPRLSSAPNTANGRVPIDAHSGDGPGLSA
jgi:hypothetical protein